jgi:hypothetical protein
MERQCLAKEFIEHLGESVEEWMLWEGWTDWVGCESCYDGGRDAICWGKAACHGFENGCGCAACYERDQWETEHPTSERRRRGTRSSPAFVV